MNNNFNSSMTSYPTAVNKNELLIGKQVQKNIVDQRGVLLLSSGSTITKQIKARLWKWGKVFFK